MSRLDEISNVMVEINRLLEWRGTPDLEDRFGATLGECDWLGELQRLLYEDTNGQP